MTHDNVVETLAAAFFHELEDFFESAADFLAKYGEVVAESEEWQTAEANNALMDKLEEYILAQ